MTFEIEPLSPYLGAEVRGADLRIPLGDNAFGEIYRAWVEADGLLVIRDQDITPGQQIAFCRRLGDLAVAGSNPIIAKYQLPGHPEIFRVSNKKAADGTPLGREDAGTYWHADGTWQTRPSKASVLYAIEVPRVGGDTMFTDLYRAYDMLSDTMKGIVGALQAVHCTAANQGTGYEKEYAGKEDVVASQTATHPLVITHPDSGRKALFVNRGYTSHIVGMNRDESDAMLQFLFRHSTAPELVYRHSWRQGDLTIWDNRCTAHYAVADYKTVGDRYLHRVSVKGDWPA